MEEIIIKSILDYTDILKKIKSKKEKI